MKILILTFGTRGDVQPYLSLSCALISRGHYVDIVTHPTYKKFIEDHGVGFVEYPGPDPQGLFDYCVNVGIFGPHFVRNITRIATNFMESWATVVEKSIGKYDLIISTFTSIDHGIHIAEASKIPVCIAHYVPIGETSYFFSPYAPSLLRSGTKNPSIFNKWSHQLIEFLFGILSRPQSNNLRKRLGLPLLQTFMFDHSWKAKFEAPRLYLHSPSFLPSPPDWPSDWRVVGYNWLPEPKYDPPAVLKDFLENDERPIYVGYGSVNVPGSRELLTKILKAIEKTGVRALISTSENLNVQIDSSKILFYRDPIPHSWLFPRVKLAIHHGGAGTVAYALKAGIPSIIMPFFGDHHLWAARLHDIGCGPPALSSKSSIDTIAKTIRITLDDTELLRRVSKLSLNMTMEDGNKLSCELLEHLQKTGSFPSNPNNSNGTRAHNHKINSSKSYTKKAFTALALVGGVSLIALAVGKSPLPLTFNTRTH